MYIWTKPVLRHEFFRHSVGFQERVIVHLRSGEHKTVTCGHISMSRKGNNLFMYIFSYHSFTDPVSSLDCMQSNGKMIYE
jgi:hypothetical protein